MDQLAFNCVPIGVVESPYKTLKETPLAGREVVEESVIRIFPEYRECIYGLDEVQHIYVICWLHEAKRDVLKVHPRHDTTLQIVGVFCSRSPERPNPISMCFVDVHEISDDTITVTGLDILDGTPVLDIKPFIEHYDTE